MPCANAIPYGAWHHALPRKVRLALAFLVVAQPAAAQVRSARVALRPVGASIAGVGSSPAPRLFRLDVSPGLTRAPSLGGLPAAPAPVLAGPSPEPAGLSVENRLTELTLGAARDLRELQTLRDAPSEGSRQVADEGFDRLLDRVSVPAGAGDIAHGPMRSAGQPSRLARAGPASLPSARETPRPRAPPTLDSKRNARWYLAGTAAYKLGMEALGLAVPLLAMTVFGSITWAAVMTVGWVLSQALFGTLAGGLLDRRPPEKILKWSMAGQAAAVTGLLGLFLADKLLPMALGFPLFNPYLLLVFYSLAGGFMGAADTSRQVMPPQIAGQDERAIKVFNARTHIAYEVAGVAGALGAGLAIKTFGLGAALFIHPPAYLLAAWAFSRLSLAPRAAMPAAAVEPSGSPRALLGAWRDLRDGFSAVWSSPLFKWGSLALIVPLAVHRLLEGLIIPAFAKGVLQDPSQAAWIIGASNFGELLGALLLTKTLLSNGAPRTAFWVRLMALGFLGLWGLSAAQNLWILLPLIALGSLTWAASDLSLRGKLQKGLPESLRGRAFGFIGAVGYVAILAASLGLGALMDALGSAPVLLVFNLALAALILLLLKAARVLGKSPPGSDPRAGD